MIGLGIDLCQVERIEKAMATHANFLSRYYTEEEQAYIAQRGSVGAQSAAAMFAAKEAFLKALGVGLSGGIALHEVGVTHNEQGCPSYALSSAALEQLRQRGFASAELSLSHEGGLAIAMCLLIREPFTAR